MVPFRFLERETPMRESHVGTGAVLVVATTQSWVEPCSGLTMKGVFLG